MFDIGWQELFIVAVLALIVVGPKDLPRALRTIMGIVRKARGYAREFQDGLDDVVREADLDDMKAKLEGLSDGEVEKTIKDTIDPLGDLADGLDMTEVKDDLDAMGNETTGNETTGNETTSEETTDEETAHTEQITDMTPSAPARSVGEEAKTPQPESDKDS
jgi:sec-independent protein translocase protein TatB